MRRSDFAVWAGWPVFLALELWIAWHGFQRPTSSQLLLEVVGWLLVGAAQARFAAEGPARSPLWSGVVPMVFTAALIGPRGGTGLVHLIGLCAAAWVVVSVADRALRPGLVAGLVAGALGAAGARYLVLSKAAEGSAGAQTSVARSPGSRLAWELQHAPWDAEAAGGDGPPLVLITVDTLRADHGEAMEVYRRLAASGVVYQEAVSTSSWTVPAVASTLTGRLPAEHGAGLSPDGRLQGISPDATTLAERLRGAGYHTAAFTTNAWLTASLGFHRGFDVWRHGDESFHHLLALASFPARPPARTADAVVDRAVAWLNDAPPRGWFLWVHLLDPHLPYAHATDPLVAGLSDERLRSGLRLTEDVVRRTREGYAAEVAAADAALGRLLDALEARGVLRDGVVILTADHGEELWDHGATGHGHSHHREVVQVPLVVAGAGLAAGQRRDPVSLTDVAGTLAAVAGLSADGGDLLSEATPERIVTTQGNAYFWQQRSAWGLGAHAIVSAPDEAVRCFGLDDHREQVDVPCMDGHPTLEAARAVRGPAAGEQAEVAEGALRALGYVE